MSKPHLAVQNDGVQGSNDPIGRRIASNSSPPPQLSQVSGIYTYRLFKNLTVDEVIRTPKEVRHG